MDSLRDELARTDRQIAELSQGIESQEQLLKEIKSNLQSMRQEREKLYANKRNLISPSSSYLNDGQPSDQWASKDEFPWSAELHSLLRERFALEKFRALQLETINATLSGVDVLLIMPTGGGKSLCFQLPALVDGPEGFTLVVSPLISLMEDQLMAMKRRGLSCAMLDASASRERQAEVYNSMTGPKAGPKKGAATAAANNNLLIYVTPEKVAKSKQFMSKLEKAYASGRLKRVVIDEVHCCSQWGHDFRPDYKMLGILKKQFRDVPILGLTATANEKVVKDIQSMLNLRDCAVFRSSFHRPNLVYELRYSAGDVVEEMADIIKSTFPSMAGIVYCFSQKETETVSKQLCGRSIRAACYHAGMDAGRRSSVHSQWAGSKVQVIVATVAFGMGIDKSDVRFVLHYSPSKSLDNLYQEQGRAGRDGRPAVTIVFFKLSDVFRISGMVYSEKTGTDNLYKVVSYCHNSSVKCRRRLMADHFGETGAFVRNEIKCNSTCDSCCQKPDDIVEIDISPFCWDLAQLARTANAKEQRLTAKKLVDLWLSKSSPIKTAAGVTSDFSTLPVPVKSTTALRAVCERILLQALLDGWLAEDMHFTPYSVISYIVPGTRAGYLHTSAAQSNLCIVQSPVSIVSRLKGKSLSEWAAILDMSPMATTTASGRETKTLGEASSCSATAASASTSRRQLSQVLVIDSDEGDEDNAHSAVSKSSISTQHSRDYKSRPEDSLQAAQMEMSNLLSEQSTGLSARLAGRKAFLKAKPDFLDSDDEGDLPLARLAGRNSSLKAQPGKVTMAAIVGTAPKDKGALAAPHGKQTGKGSKNPQLTPARASADAFADFLDSDDEGDLPLARLARRSSPLKAKPGNGSMAATASTALKDKGALAAPHGKQIGKGSKNPQLAPASASADVFADILDSDDEGDLPLAVGKRVSLLSTAYRPPALKRKATVSAAVQAGGAKKSRILYSSSSDEN